jgi:3-deoxy-D-manno-octulosonic-acid transferase
LFNKKASLWVNGRKKSTHINFTSKTVWMHCASLGEFEQGRPVLEAIKRKYPHYPIVLSFFSPSGFEIRKNYPEADKVIYRPLDTPHHAEKIINDINPALVIWVKYEFWWNHLSALKKRNIPVLLISGIFRSSQPFFKWYGSLWRKGIQSFRFLFLQDKISVNLLHSIQVNNTAEIGDTRFDRVAELAENKIELADIKNFIGNCPLIVAGSTWQKDENILKDSIPLFKDVKWIIAPHDVNPTNIERIKNEFRNSICYYDLLSIKQTNQSCNILIIDTIGLLSSIYQYADIAYIGGGFGKGIHNILEAAVYGIPVLFGPNHFKFKEAVELIEMGGAFSTSNRQDFTKKVSVLLNEKNTIKETGEIAKNYVSKQTGASEKIIDYITLNRLLTN